MANRHLARSIVMQTLFEWDFSNISNEEVFSVLKRNQEEFAPGSSDNSFMENLLETVINKQKDLDTIIVKAAPDWPIDKISYIDRNILRLGLAELLFSDAGEVPPKVAINESIELAKSFGGETSGKFVNGVLGAVYKEMGEPGKNDVSKKKKMIKDVPEDQLAIEQLGGSLVYSHYEGQIYFALVHDVFGHWTLSKGHLDEGESLEDGVVRVIKDEMNITVSLKDKIGDNEYIAYDPEKGKIKKRVSYYLSEAPFQELKLPGGEGGLDDVRWFTLEEIGDLNFYGDVLPLVTKGVSIIANNNS